MAFLRLPASMLLLASFLLLLYGTTSSADQSHDLLAKRSHDLPLAKRSHDLPLAKRSHDLPLAKLSHDLPLAKRSHDLPLAKRSHDPLAKRSHDPLAKRSHDLPLAKRALAFPAKRMKRDMVPDTREKVAATLNGVTELVSVTTEAVKNSKKLVDIFKGLSSFGNMLPGFLGVAFSFINLALAFVPQDDPQQKIFDELNRKLDALSFQVSDLGDLVEWHNYKSAYYSHELNIILAWEKYNRIRSKPSEDQARLFQGFIKEFPKTKDSVNILYSLLTNKDLMLTENLNDLLTDRFKCDISEMRKWHMHLSGLMFKGIVLKQLYGRLINPQWPIKGSRKLRDVYNAQKAAIRNCLDKSEEYMKTDVKEKATKMDHNNKQAVAEEVKTFLDEKYFWYDWVVVVYDSSQKANYAFYDMTTVEVGSIQVTVGYTQAVEQEKKVREDGEKVEKCYNKKYETIYESRRRPEVVDVTKCEDIKKEISECNVNEFVKVTHISFGENHAQAPKPLRTFECRHWFAWNALKGYVSRIHVYYSKEAGDPCTENPCENQEKCERLVKSNEHLCE